MVYRVIGLMSGSSLDGLDIAFAEFHENGGTWSYELLNADCYTYTTEWSERLKNATGLAALDYQVLHAEYGHYLGQQVNKFIQEHGLHYQVALIASHGHTTFHVPLKKMTGQLGEGAGIAAETQLPVVTDLRALDIAFGGQGAPIVPIGEKLLLGEYDFFLNLGGIANISVRPHPNPPQKESASDTQANTGAFIAFDICPANRVLNLLINELGKEYDAGGAIAAGGKLNGSLLDKLNELAYYKQPYPKSLANDFGTGVVYPLIRDTGCGTSDSLRTYVEHIAVQIRNAITGLSNYKLQTTNYKLLVTGGGAFNTFLIQRLRKYLEECNIDVIVPDAQLVNFKEALIMAFIGVLRWRQEYNVLSSVTGARRDSIGGALWMGQEA